MGFHRQYISLPYRYWWFKHQCITKGVYTRGASLRWLFSWIAPTSSCLAAWSMMDCIGRHLNHLLNLVSFIEAPLLLSRCYSYSIDQTRFFLALKRFQNELVIDIRLYIFLQWRCEVQNFRIQQIPWPRTSRPNLSGCQESITDPIRHSDYSEYIT